VRRSHLGTPVWLDGGARQTPQEAWLQLSARERQVLRLAAEGRTVKQIAECLGLSFKTVDHYKSAGMAKLGVHKCVQVVKAVMAARESLLRERDGTASLPNP
jgi:DNA-binding CsgD family transcriptional regulator